MKLGCKDAATCSVGSVSSVLLPLNYRNVATNTLRRLSVT